ncbi:MAG: hypothetical protein MJ123_03940 [Lachnospiraceae bacterium]|nr:hypothetical protein [Lachnospiraceae bacterium]
MAINGIGGFGGFENYKIMNIPKVDVETVKKQDEEALELQNQPKLDAPVANTATEDNRSKSADLDNISLNFNKGDDYSYIGSESDINNLDMQKAISDMRKDKILEDYQYFVGSSENLMTNFNNEDGAVFMKF